MIARRFSFFEVTVDRVESLFWGGVRSWVHGEPEARVYETFVALFDGVEVESWREQAISYIAENLGSKSSSFGALAAELRRDYRARFAHRAAMLSRDPVITSVRFEPNDPVDAAVIERVRRDWHVDVPDAMLAFFEQMNGYRLVWESTSHNSYARYCSSGVNPLEQVFGGRRGMKQQRTWGPSVFDEILWWRDDITADLEWGDDEWLYEAVSGELPVTLDAQRLKWLESIEGVSIEVGVELLEDGQTRVGLVDRELDWLTLDFEAYIEGQLAWLGYSYWYGLYGQERNGVLLNSIDLSVMLGLFPDTRPELERLAQKWGLPLAP